MTRENYFHKYICNASFKTSLTAVRTTLALLQRLLQRQFLIICVNYLCKQSPDQAYSEPGAEHYIM